MEEYLSPALRQHPLPDSERKRLRELSRYYCTVREPSTFAEDSLSTPVEEKEAGIAYLSSDITLTALTQLGVYRFGCNRSFVSLIDGENQHIISEATASISLRDRERHRELDGLYLGVTTLDLIFGVCPHAVKLFSGQEVPHLKNTDNVTANSTRYIVRDFTREEYFKERPYVTEWPHFRFYAEVPIYSPSGHILGSYCVVDNKPRMEFSEEDVVALQEISDSIARHLDNVRTVHYHRRSERLVQGLTTFVKQRPDSWDEPLPPIPSGEALSSSNMMTRDRSEVSPPDLGRLGQLSLSTEGSSPLFSKEESGDLTDATSLSVGLQDASSPKHITDTVVNSYSPENSLFDGSQGSSSPGLPGKDTVPLSARISSLFSQASTLLRDSIAVDGVLFVDACHCNSGIAPSKTDLTDWEPLPKNADPRPRSNSPCCLSGAQREETLCETFGLALDNYQPGCGHNKTHAVPSSLLQHLIAALPQGGVLHLDEGFERVDPDALASTPLQSIEAPFGISQTSQPCNRSNPQILAARLAQCFPQAKSLLFIPLWDWDKGQWLAGTFVWTKAADNERSLGLDELNYFKVFGDSIISEIARLSWSQKEKSKFDLISSISHELRSPLHGMLANTELLSTSALQPEQRDIVKALETSGLTLLDTMNHLLDFAKINNLTVMNKGGSSVTSLTSTFQLDVLVEDVVNSVFTGMRHAAAASTPAESPVSESTHDTYKSNLSVVLRIEDQNQWKVKSMTGAWRRIVMNILGNALKYTQEGFIEASLSMVKSSADRPSDVAHFCVTDTGRGMSQEFLRNKLFSPFAQEDSLSEGAGLGLSIVKQLVSFLGGSIDVKSERGVGTQVDIYIPVKLLPAKRGSAVREETKSLAKNSKFSLIGLGAYPELSEEPTGTLSPKAKRKICLQSFFTDILANQPSWSVAVVESIENAHGDIAVVEEKVLKQITKDQTLQKLAESKFTHIICLCDGLPSLALDKRVGRAPVVYLSQPFSPQKVLQILSILPEPEPYSQPTELLTPLAAAVERSIPTKPQLKISPTSAVTPLSDGDLTPSDTSQVLIVDDNEINIKILAKLMSRLGYQHEAAINGLVALNKFKESPAAFKVILMDVSMPVMDGIDATRHIRAFEREQSLTPVKIYAVTGIASESMQKDALLAGVDEYLVKPLSLQKVSTIIKPHLSEKGWNLRNV
ncbi:hypothetical protein ASPCAL13399 [Aspergillus calidoustus]|uniref:Sensor histidine kinase/response regulator n=1 Tax=Aspergillus calidoustus TaxID=454130 RepID=A0A0U4ZL03_ASPCI|nr:hypothetical protein ASPCAL13399 [Aspergillus calidoustus]